MSIPPARRRLSARVVPRAALSQAQQHEMFQIYKKYYACVDEQEFMHDLLRKDFIILLHDAAHHKLCGFSTIMHLNLQLGERPVFGVFSGDTIIEREYWGNSSLGRAFLGHLFRLKLRNLGRPVYWFLISKGYKTYLLMANNFKCHYPRFEEPTPPWAKSIINAYGEALYPGHYDRESGTIAFGIQHAHLRQGVADIDEKLKQDHPRVAFFAEVNANWQQGTELVCLARMEFFLPLRYVLRATRKAWRRLRLVSRITGTALVKERN